MFSKPVYNLILRKNLINCGWPIVWCFWVVRTLLLYTDYPLCLLRLKVVKTMTPRTAAAAAFCRPSLCPQAPFSCQLSWFPVLSPEHLSIAEEAPIIGRAAAILKLQRQFLNRLAVLLVSHFLAFSFSHSTARLFYTYFYLFKPAQNTEELICHKQ